MPFMLRKWYLDVVSRSGRLCIAYIAELTWGRLRLRYSSLLLHDADGPRSCTALRDVQLPVLSGDMLHWDSRSLRCAGAWRALSPPLERQVLQSREGSIEWCCLQPSSECRLQLEGREISGWGYAEQVNMTIAPWRIPWRWLRWGHAVCGEHWLVWLESGDGYSFRWLFLDGRSVDQVQIGDRMLSAQPFCLQLDQSVTLRHGSIVDTVLTSVPGAQSLFPWRALHIHEHKWLSQARLQLADGLREDGFAVHEAVQWP